MRIGIEVISQALDWMDPKTSNMTLKSVKIRKIVERLN
jgi:hypothetical protein